MQNAFAALYFPCPMKQKTLSAGVVVLRPGQRGYLYLVLRCYDYWDFPKGMVEAGESPIAAACREVREEASLAELEFPWGQAFIETEPYGRGKVARYYLGLSRRGDVELPLNPQLGRPEHHEFRWLDYASARALLPPRLQPVLDWAHASAGA